MSTPYLQLRAVSVSFRTGSGPRRHHLALDHVSLDVHAGETVGLVGESGSGKTTMVRLAVGLVRPSSGAVVLTPAHPGRSRAGSRQLVGQNPRFALNPQLQIWRSVAEPVLIAGASGRRARDTARQLLDAVGLPGDYADRYPHELSGGQQQRAAIARVLTARPELVVFDEAVSALDVSVQVQAINLIKDLQAEHGFAALFVSHDLAAVRYAADRVAVLYRSQLMLLASAASFYDRTHHPYGLALQAAITDDSTLALHEPDPAAPPPTGCVLAPRCPFAVDVCTTQRPVLVDVDGQLSACHRAHELRDAHRPQTLRTRPLGGTA